MRSTYGRRELAQAVAEPVGGCADGSGKSPWHEKLVTHGGTVLSPCYCDTVISFIVLLKSKTQG